MKYLNLILLFLALIFDSEASCNNWIRSFESRWDHANDWCYAQPSQLKDGRWFVHIKSNALLKLTEEEKSKLIEVSEDDLLISEYKP